MVGGLRPAIVRQAGRGEVRVSRLSAGWRRYAIDDPNARCRVVSQTLVVALPDAAALVRLAVSGLLVGKVRRLRLRLATAPAWLMTGTRPLRVSRIAESFTWRRRDEALEVTFGWSRPCDVNQALRSAVTASLRARPWDQISGPVYALDRTAWMHGTSSWPQGLLAASAPELEVDALGRPMGPFLPAELSVSARPAKRWANAAPDVITAVANPFGRRLVIESHRVV